MKDASDNTIKAAFGFDANWTDETTIPELCLDKDPVEIYWCKNTGEPTADNEASNALAGVNNTGKDIK